jgi:hypothetical protein
MREKEKAPLKSGVGSKRLQVFLSIRQRRYSNRLPYARVIRLKPGVVVRLVVM